jgi:hypothetical protein
VPKILPFKFDGFFLTSLFDLFKTTNILGGEVPALLVKLPVKRHRGYRYGAFEPKVGCGAQRVGGAGSTHTTKRVM